MIANRPDKDPPTVWCLTDDRAGNRSQCLGVADALGWAYQVKDLDYGGLSSLPNLLLGASFAGLKEQSRARLAPPWPDLVIAAGRRTAPPARRIGRLASSGCFLAQIMHPGAGAGDFGLIAQPRHDSHVGGGNILPMTGAPHQLTAAGLEEEAKRWKGRFDDLPRPWIAVVVGGTTRRRRFTGAMARELGSAASKMALSTGGSLLVTTSRRTGDAVEDLIGALAAPNRVYRWGQGKNEGDEKENPYLGYLALADAVVVTGDSVSMCSEACAGTAPVYIFAPPALTVPKHARLHADLYEQGYARPMNGVLEDWTHPPLNPAAEIAAAIRERLGV
jgi:mitochondrial fission protein ELM1